VNARFLLNNTIVDKIVDMSKCEKSAVEIVEIERRYDGEYVISFPHYARSQSIQAKTILDIAYDAKNDIKVLSEKTKTEEGIKAKVVAALDEIIACASKEEKLSEAAYNAIVSLYPKSLKKSSSSEIYPKFETIKAAISDAFLPLNSKDPAKSNEIKKLILSEMPSFVYYSNYGNLDAEIYLPHAVKLLKGEKIPGFDNAAKVRTLRVLFEFVNLDSEEVLELGQDPLKQERVRTITKTIDSRNLSILLEYKKRKN